MFRWLFVLLAKSEHPDSISVCNAACLLVATDMECMNVEPKMFMCNNLWHDGRKIYFCKSAVDPAWTPLPIETARHRVSIPYEFCPLGSRMGCSFDGECLGLAWMKGGELHGKHKYDKEGKSRVFCSYYAFPFFAAVENKPGYIDPCKELCGLSFVNNGCHDTRRYKGICLNLVWANSIGWLSTKLEYVLGFGQREVLLRDAYEKLRVDSCQVLCDKTVGCVSSICRKDNRTCTDLFYKRLTHYYDNALISCFGGGCAGTRVVCDLEGDAPGSILGRYSQSVKSSSILLTIFALFIILIN